MNRFTIAAIAAIAAPLFATGYAAPASAQQVEIEASGPVIELSVYESISAEPDLVTIGAGVSVEAPSAVEAMRQNAAEMRRVIDAIKRQGVDEADIQTTGINLNARFDYNRQSQSNTFRGYEVSNRVSVKLREVDQTGQVLDALVAAGATDLSGPSFSIEDDEAAKETARASAVERARARADAYAKLYGYGGVRILSISEALRGNTPRPEAMMRSMASDAVAESAPVQPGMVSTGVSISVKYEMINEPGSAGKAAP